MAPTDDADPRQPDIGRWFTYQPEIIAVARPNEQLGLAIHVQRFRGGCELLMMDENYEASWASEHATVEEAKAQAADVTGLTNLDWQPWVPIDEE